MYLINQYNKSLTICYCKVNEACSYAKNPTKTDYCINYLHPLLRGKHRYGWEMIFNDRSLPILLLWWLICYITVGCLMPMSNKWIERNVFHLSDSNYIVMSSCIFVSYSYVLIYLHAFLLTTLFLTLADCTDSETNVFASHLVLALQIMLFIHWKN